MAAFTHRLDRLLNQTLKLPRSSVRAMLAQGRIVVDGKVAAAVNQPVDQFTRVEVDGQALPRSTPVYVKLHKPAGVLSATRDDRHTTVIDLLEHPARDTLHLVGRLDRASSGLVLLTNDGRWSRALMSPEAAVEKVYDVRVRDPLTAQMVEAFAAGMHFAYEDITTQPARLEIVEDTLARVTLVEGRYHQIKRMFGRFRNPVLALHRVRIGAVALPADLAPGRSCALDAQELRATHGAVQCAAVGATPEPSATGAGA
jgi:16S rRNA pseudouridine516 synthase